MAVANVLSLVEKNKELDNVILYGKVLYYIEKPAMLGNLKPTQGNFALLEVYAVNFRGEDYAGKENGFYGDKNVYIANGNLIICVCDDMYIGKSVVVGGSRGRGCKIKKQFSSGNSREGFQSLVFKRVGTEWGIAPNDIRLLTYKDISGTYLEEYLEFKDNGIAEMSYPHSVKAMMEFYGVMNPIILESDSAGKETQSSSDETINTMGEENITGIGSREAIVRSNNTGIRFSNYTNMGSSIPRLPNGRVDTTRIDMHLVEHLDAQEESELSPIIREEIETQSLKSNNYARDLSRRLAVYYEDFKEGKDLDSIANYIYSSYSRICERYSLPLAMNKVKEKGRYLVDKLLDSLYDAKFIDENASDKKESSETSRKKLAEGIERIKKSVEINPRVISKDYEGFVPILGDELKMATLIIANTLGIDETILVYNYNSCYRNFEITLKDWFLTLLVCPYKLGLLGTGMPLIVCDKVFFTYGCNLVDRYFEEEILNDIVLESFKYRDYLITFEILRKETTNISGTLINYSEIYSKKYELYSKVDSRLFTENGLPLRDCYIEAVKLMVGSALSPVDKDTMIGTNPVTEELVNELVEIGVLDTVNDSFVVFTKDMQKEYTIYTTLLNKGKEMTGITEEQVSKIVDRFEDDRGFKLEALQRKGVSLVRFKAAVLSGCAGSGKTTTSDCMAEVLKEYLPEYNIIYGTPTGKACRRLSEVVHSNVRTLHSLFGVGMDGDPYLCSTSYTKFYKNSKDIYILDEMAMCNIDLMYAVVKNLGVNDLIFFLGDIKQLPPIGRGIPFSMLMTILPCVELGVSKRAAEGSLVNYNCTLINFLSDRGQEELISDDSTFVIEDCADDMIKYKALDMFKGLIEGKYGGEKYEEDDITVISQYQTDRIAWSVPMLNPLLQEYLRSNDRVLFHNNKRKFYENERVIHLKRNRYDMRRYQLVDNVFQELVTFGAVNGEVGKLLGVIRSDRIRILPFDEDRFITSKGGKEKMSERDKELLGKWLEKEDSLRDDTQITDPDQYFVVVKYYDTELQQDALVLYRARERKVITYDDIDVDTVFEGMDLDNLDLAYALTAHKMQGSQERAIIAVFGSSGSPMFVNRNMINVIFTRSQQFVGAIGSVRGKDSAIAKGRRYKSPSSRKDILGVLAGEVKI